MTPTPAPRLPPNLVPPEPHDAAARLLEFNRDLLDQGWRVAAAHRAPGMPDFERPAGAHLRHVIEHYEALVAGRATGTIDYDARARDRLVERDPAVACARIETLRGRLTGWPEAALGAPVEVRGQAGLRGELAFAVGSTLGRELVFVASHAVHHFALLADYCVRHGIAVDAEFGVAPSTVAHERSTATHSPQRKETQWRPTTAS